MITKVLDSWALMAFFKGESAAATVEILFQRASAERIQLLLCVVNLGEIYYGMMRTGTKEEAEMAMLDLERLPIELVPVDTNLQLVRQAAIYKASGKISHADCFAAALARLRKAELVTGDQEFKVLEGQIKISWL